MAATESLPISSRLADMLAQLQATDGYGLWFESYGDQVVQDGEAQFLAVERDVPVRLLLNEAKKINRPVGLITDSPYENCYFMGVVGGSNEASSLEALSNMPSETTVGDVVDMSIWYGKGVAVSVEEASVPTEDLSYDLHFAR